MPKPGLKQTPTTAISTVAPPPEAVGMKRNDSRVKSGRTIRLPGAPPTGGSRSSTCCALLPPIGKPPPGSFMPEFQQGGSLRNLERASIPRASTLSSNRLFRSMNSRQTKPSFLSLTTGGRVGWPCRRPGVPPPPTPPPRHDPSCPKAVQPATPLNILLLGRRRLSVPFCSYSCSGRLNRPIGGSSHMVLFFPAPSVVSGGLPICVVFFFLVCSRMGCPQRTVFSGSFARLSIG